MLNRIKEHKIKLINVLNNKLFIKRKGTYIINNKLTSDKLNNITVYVRKIIINLYLTCEEDYLNALKILEYIIEYDKKRNSDKYNKINNDNLNTIITERNSIKNTGVVDDYDNSSLQHSELVTQQEKLKSEKKQLEQQKERITSQQLLSLDPQISLQPQISVEQKKIDSQLMDDINKIKNFNEINITKKYILNDRFNIILKKTLDIMKLAFINDINLTYYLEKIIMIHNLEKDSLKDYNIIELELNNLDLIDTFLDNNLKKELDLELKNKLNELNIELNNLFMILNNNDENRIKRQIYHSIRKYIIYVIRYLYYNKFYTQ